MKDKIYYMESRASWEVSQTSIVSFKLSELVKKVISDGLITKEQSKSIKNISDLDIVDGFFMEDYIDIKNPEEKRLVFESMSEPKEDLFIHSEEDALRDVDWDLLYKSGLIGYLRQNPKYNEYMSVADERDLFINILNNYAKNKIH